MTAINDFPQCAIRFIFYDQVQDDFVALGNDLVYEVCIHKKKCNSSPKYNISKYLKEGAKIDLRQKILYKDFDRMLIKNKNSWLQKIYFYCRLNALIHKEKVSRLFRAKNNGLEFTFQDGDKVLILGPAWSFIRGMRRIAQEELRRDIEIYYYIYDLIPLMDQYAFSEIANKDLFRHWMNTVESNKSSRVLTSSCNNQKDFEQLGVRVPKEHISVVPLPHEHRCARGLGSTKNKICVNHSYEYVLFVGPPTGRKNGQLLTHVWWQLARDIGFHKTPYLIFTDSRGREQIPESVIDGLANKLVFLDGVDDEALAELYQGALFTIFVSEYEGWGMPVGESLWYGTPCIASNVSSIPEVGGDFCLYVDPHDEDDILGMIKKVILDRNILQSERERLESMPKRTWNEFVQNVIDVVSE